MLSYTNTITNENTFLFVRDQVNTMVVSELYSTAYATVKGTDLPSAPHSLNCANGNVSGKEKEANIYEQIRVFS